LGYIVKCPQCGEINPGSRLTCTICEADLVGIRREKDPSDSDTPEEMSVVANIISTPGRNRYAHIFVGLIVGLCGFLLISFFSFGGRLCGGFFIAIGMGILSGVFTAQYANTLTKDHASRLGAISGGIAGFFAFAGQIFGSLLPSLLFRINDFLGMAPGASSSMLQEMFQDSS